jgi:hypothetical protein
MNKKPHSHRGSAAFSRNAIGLPRSANGRADDFATQTKLFRAEADQRSWRRGSAHRDMPVEPLA